MNWNGEFYRAASSAENTARTPYHEFVEFQIQLGSAFVFALLKVYVWVSGAAKAIWRWYATRETYDELNALDDRILKDIGISRADIPTVSRISASDASFTFRDLPR